ncbi:MAG: histone deacetylase, partial [Gammaproteobacteria bacterium]|nr:histone deacetylase [Gammaproteobacteria bacterium]NNL99192.1 histone deacetylase [Gammaproteobacteria bacterium]
MSTPDTTAFVYDEAFVTHDTGPGHPERPERASHTLKYLKAQDWFGELNQLSARNATEEEIAAIHPLSYQQRVRAACDDGLPFLDSMDVAISPESYDVALLAAGAPLALADAIMAGKAANGFALLRPPGHHAEASEALGFCLFNNVAILARYLQRQHGLDRIAIVDWDVHHGNGTQHAFEEAPDIMYVSTHQYPYYP